MFKSWSSVNAAINALCGIGILSTPYALKEGGWFSILILFILGTITCYTGILLKRCLESSPHLQTYPDIGQAAFGLCGRICIASSCVEFLIMMSDNLAASFPNVQMDVAGIHLDSYQVCAIASTLVILPTVWLRNLSLLSFISAGGVVTLALVVVCLLWVGVATDVGFHPSGKALDYTKLPITIGIYSFCYGSHSVFPNIYSSMKAPSRFPSVLVISFLVAASLYAGVAVCGFLMFGEATNPQFTLNLPTNFVASDIAGWSVIVAPLTKFGLSITPVALGIEELLPAAQLRSHTMSVLIRTCLVVSTLVVALAVPYFEVIPIESETLRLRVREALPFSRVRQKFRIFENIEAILFLREQELGPGLDSPDLIDPTANSLPFPYSTKHVLTRALTLRS
ncbi:UNVERIFIED_CONTAM: Amino acid transporter AVT1E [Sesamum radiatum]|uniref:Amino acid transporter AVT1E n=1 Tax=Sesamum radiatum TaxID=300843 RepID=A0AAW2KSC1_SESRA